MSPHFIFFFFFFPQSQEPWDYNPYPGPSGALNAEPAPNSRTALTTSRSGEPRTRQDDATHVCLSIRTVGQRQTRGGGGVCFLVCPRRALIGPRALTPYMSIVQYPHLIQEHSLYPFSLLPLHSQ